MSVAAVARKSATRADIVSAALELLETEQPDHVTGVRIARAADVSRSTLYRHFDSVCALIGEVVDDVLAEFIRECTDRVAPECLERSVEIALGLLMEPRYRLLANFVRYSEVINGDTMRQHLANIMASAIVDKRLHLLIGNEEYVGHVVHIGLGGIAAEVFVESPDGAFVTVYAEQVLDLIAPAWAASVA